MAKYIVRGQMWRRHDGQRFYPGAEVDLDGKAPAGWEPVDENVPAKPAPQEQPGLKDPRIKR